MKTHKLVQATLILILMGIGLVVASHPTNLSIPLMSSQEHVAYPDPQSPFEATVNLAEAERERIQRHLTAVEADMRAHPPAGLTDAQLKKRLALLDELRAYRERGVFPKNLDFPDRLIPYFIDAAGVPCAMGQLVIASGHAAFAEEIRATRNNAYIAELSAMDGRLAAWGEEHGITLEEAARVQPAYGPPRLSSVVKLRLDTLGRPWAFGGDANNLGGSALFYRDSSQWKLHSSMGFGFCLSKMGEPLIFSGSSVTWKGKNFSLPGAVSSAYACAWSVNDSVAWTGGRQGLLRLRRVGQDSLAHQFYGSSLVSDTVSSVAVTGTTIWAATPRGVYRRSLQGNDTVVAVWDSAALGGRNVTGLAAGSGASGTVWLGIEGAPISSSTFFSTRGLRRWNGTGWSTYRSSMSSILVPGDTVFALAVRDTASAWIAVRTGFYRFQPATGGGQKVADIPAELTVYDMAGNASGFYAGTSNGVYQFVNDSLIWLGRPAVTSLRPDMAGKHRSVDPKLRMLRSGAASDESGLRTVLGQKTGPQTATGVYVSPVSKP